MKQATASCMKFSKELTKYYVNVVTHTLRLDFKYVHAEESWICPKKCSPAYDKNLSNSLQMPTCHSKEREEPDMVLSRGRSIISLLKSVREIHKKRTSSSVLDRLQNDEVFHASQPQDNWTKEWCEYLDYVRTIDITHNATPEHLERYATLCHFRYHPQ